MKRILLTTLAAVGLTVIPFSLVSAADDRSEPSCPQGPYEEPTTTVETRPYEEPRTTVEETTTTEHGDIGDPPLP